MLNQKGFRFDTITGRLMLLFVILFAYCCISVSADGQYHDIRCKCICTGKIPISHGPNDTHGESDARSMFISDTDASGCNCDDVVLSKFKHLEESFCSLCECKHDYRNTDVMKYAVIFIVCSISFLVVYMVILNLLEYRGIKKTPYQKHVDEDQQKEETTSSGFEMRRIAARQTSDLTPVFSQSRNVLDRVGHQQSRWKKQVKEQRKNIYDKHTMLN